MSEKIIFKKILFILIVVLFFSCEKEKFKMNENKNLKGYLITEKETELSIFAMDSGKALNTEWPIFKKATEMTNIRLKNVASQNQTNQTEAYNLLVSSGQLPDIVSYMDTAVLERLGMEGGLVPLEDLIEKYAPNIKKFWEQNPRYKKDAIAADGHIYVIPNYYDYFNSMPSTGYFIRKDWLEKLNLKEPETTEELYNVLTAFRDKDPNGNGKKDEIPFFFRSESPKDTIRLLVDVFKARTFWYEDSAGKIKFGAVQPEFREAIKNIAQWYKEGLIDKEIFTRGLVSRDYMLSNNIGGYTNDWFGSTASYNEKLGKNIPDFDLAFIAPPKYKNNNQTYQARTTEYGAWGISSKSKKVIEAIKYFDFWYNEEGRRLWNYGIEGSEWVLKDEKPLFTDKVLNNTEGKTALQVLKETGAQFRLGVAQDAEYERQWYPKEAVEAIDTYIKNNYVHELLPSLKYTKEEAEDFSKINTQLNAYVEEMSQKWIMGVSDVDKDWEEYIKRIEQIGLKKAEQIQQKAYDRFMK